MLLSSETLYAQCHQNTRDRNYCFERAKTSCGCIFSGRYVSECDMSHVHFETWESIVAVSSTHRKIRSSCGDRFCFGQAQREIPILACAREQFLAFLSSTVRPTSMLLFIGDGRLRFLLGAGTTNMRWYLSDLGPKRKWLCIVLTCNIIRAAFTAWSR